MDLTTLEGRRELGQRIQSAIAESGCRSLPAFAERLGCSRALIYQYVKGEVLVQLDRLQEIAQATDRPLAWFLGVPGETFSGQAAALQAERDLLQARLSGTERDLAAERKRRSSQAEQSRRTLAETLRELCQSRRRGGDSEGLVEAAARWLEVAQELDDQQGVMEANLHLGHAWLNLANYGKAERPLNEALQLAVARRDAPTQYSVRQELIRALQAGGRAREAFAQARALASADLWWPRWGGLVAQAALAEQVGDLDAAEVLLQTASEVVEDSDAPLERKLVARTYLISNQVNVALAHGRYRDALQGCETMRASAAQAGLSDQLREATLNLGIASLRCGEVSVAARHFAQLREWGAFAGDQRLASLAQVFDSERLWRCRDLAGAKAAALTVLDEAVSFGAGQVLGEAELVLGQVYRYEGRTEEARHYLMRCQGRAERLELCRLGVAAALERALLDDRRAEAGALLADLANQAAATGYEDLEAEALLGRADRVPDPHESLLLALEARSLSEVCGYFWGVLGALRAEARAHLRLRRTDECADRLVAALRLAHSKLGDQRGRESISSELETRASLVAAYREAGELEHADRWEQLDLLAPLPSSRADRSE
ncbi:MAG TPA: helix-turn-helix transcriptional regulator [Armatimonadota bacterium]|jgi:transcriptional regulator with XRE-family HTH domain